MQNRKGRLLDEDEDVLCTSTDSDSEPDTSPQQVLRSKPTRGMEKNRKCILYYTIIILY